MADLVMDDEKDKRGNGQDDGQPSDMHRRRRGRNIALGLLLAAVVVLFYVVTIVKMSGN
jgi:ferric-dicitrate binding protein FerR (iron transport regulator)